MQTVLHQAVMRTHCFCPGRFQFCSFWDGSEARQITWGWSVVTCAWIGRWSFWRCWCGEDTVIPMSSKTWSSWSAAPTWRAYTRVLHFFQIPYFPTSPWSTKGLRMCKWLNIYVKENVSLYWSLIFFFWLKGILSVYNCSESMLFP